MCLHMEARLMFSRGVSKGENGLNFEERHNTFQFLKRISAITKVSIS